MKTWEIRSGDSLKLLEAMPDSSIDAIVTDPPYSSGGAFRSDRNKKTSQKYQMTATKKQYPEFFGDNRDQRSFFRWCVLWLSECWRVAKDQAPICMFTDWRQLPSMSDALQASGFVWRGVAVWDKTEASRPTPGRFRQQCEFILWGSKGAFKPDEKKNFPGCWRHPVVGAHKRHLTGKPVNLLKEILKITPKNGIVLDPFCGSGTTGVACIQAGRKFLGMELSPEYSKIAEDWLKESEKAEKSQYELLEKTGAV